MGVNKFSSNCNCKQYYKTNHSKQDVAKAGLILGASVGLIKTAFQPTVFQRVFIGDSLEKQLKVAYRKISPSLFHNVSMGAIKGALILLLLNCVSKRSKHNKPTFPDKYECANNQDKEACTICIDKKIKTPESEQKVVGEGEDSTNVENDDDSTPENESVDKVNEVEPDNIDDDNIENNKITDENDSILSSEQEKFEED